MQVLLFGYLKQASSPEKPVYASLLTENAFKERSTTKPKQDKQQS